MSVDCPWQPIRTLFSIGIFLPRLMQLECTTAYLHRFDMEQVNRRSHHELVDWFQYSNGLEMTENFYRELPESRLILEIRMETCPDPKRQFLLCAFQTKDHPLSLISVIRNLSNNVTRSITCRVLLRPTSSSNWQSGLTWSPSKTWTVLNPRYTIQKKSCG
jgi:hypothetical protein